MGNAAASGMSCRTHWWLDVVVGRATVSRNSMTRQRGARNVGPFICWPLDLPAPSIRFSWHTVIQRFTPRAGQKVTQTPWRMSAERRLHLRSVRPSIWPDSQLWPVPTWRDQPVSQTGPHHPADWYKGGAGCPFNGDHSGLPDGVKLSPLCAMRPLRSLPNSSARFPSLAHTPFRASAHGAWAGYGRGYASPGGAPDGNSHNRAQGSGA